MALRAFDGGMSVGPPACLCSTLFCSALPCTALPIPAACLSPLPLEVHTCRFLFLEWCTNAARFPFEIRPSAQKPFFLAK
ncbi:uncharacterized protein BJ171DRAFT_295618 [Polychytrium aggregatum]|uniref:uncharacterized protein n=1 Tax=Polychytrium aggregatum TaxID=110093 RepID=UPI0022FEF8E8|nr:uncharacterized protein BJ171DRAFT_295618 [Polychytrium aggregatum]KAI9207337.1 hypothetical protein BJ171DRAFT_295618 [Polychytrium aggregatum]